MRQKKQLALISILAHHLRVMRDIRHIIWDWNGTLLNDVQACTDAINVLLERRSLPAVTLLQYLDLFEFPVRNYYLKLGFDFSKDRWSDVAVEYHKAYALTSATAPLRDGTQAILGRVNALGIGVSVLSACENTLLRKMMGERGVLDAFENVYGLSDLYAHSKITLGQALLDDSGLSPANAIMVGDTTHDHEVAEALGIPCVLLTGGHQAESKLASCGCPVMPGLPAVLDHILATRS